MKIISASWIISSNKDKQILQNHSVVYDKKIIEIAPTDEILKKFPNITVETLKPNSVITAGFINPHIHFEFSKNKSTLKYGSFMSWLSSVIANREELIESLKDEDITNICEDLLSNGTTTIGAISSYGFDLNALSKAPQTVVFFPEVLGSKPDMVDTLYADFLARLQSAIDIQNEKFIPAIAIHAPYSTHPILIKKVLTHANALDCPVQAHFMESPEEKKWLQSDKGAFKEFFASFLGQKKALCKPIEFLELFENTPNVSFTHCTEASKAEFEFISKIGANIIHCPVSNRLLNNNKLNLKNSANCTKAIATDGLSSNTSLNILDELKMALMIHEEKNLNELSNDLIYYATAGGAKVLNLQKGQIETDFDADLVCFELSKEINDPKDLALDIILHSSKPTKVILGGQSVR